MEKKSIKSVFAIACVAVASVSGIKAYNASNQLVANSLLAENVEALSDGDSDKEICNAHCTRQLGGDCTFTYNNQYWKCQDMVKK